MQNQVVFVILKHEEKQDILNIIAEANRNTFPHILNKTLSIQSFTQETAELIDLCFANQKKYSEILKRPVQYNYGIKFNGKLVAVMLSLELLAQHEFLQMLPVKTQYETMFQHLNIESMHPGEGVYFTRLSVLPEMMGKKLGKKLVAQSCQYLLKHGYNHSIMCSIVEVSLKMFSSLGGKVLRHEQGVRPTFTYQLNFIKNDFKELIEIYERGLNK